VVGEDLAGLLTVAVLAAVVAGVGQALLLVV
jgi:hypothetical protein